MRILYGAKDRILPAVDHTMAHVAEQLPQAEVTRLDDVGHVLQEDAPTLVADELAAFFTAHPGS